jgi:hypothetical protein
MGDGETLEAAIRDARAAEREWLAEGDTRKRG